MQHQHLHMSVPVDLGMRGIDWNLLQPRQVHNQTLPGNKATTWGETQLIRCVQYYQRDAEIRGGSHLLSRASE